MAKISRSKIASYFADQIATGEQDVVTRLAVFLREEQRTGELDLIVADIEFELTRHGIILADVTSALPIDDSFETSIRSLLALKRDDQVMLRPHIDPYIIGGIKIRAAGRELDASVRHKLTKFKSITSVA